MSNPTPPDAENLARSSRDKTRGRPFGPDNPGRPFPPGNSGRPKGCRDKATTALARMFEGEAEEIGRRAIELAKEGKITAVKLVLDRAYPSRDVRRTDALELPVLKSAADAVAALGTIASAVAAGTLSIAEARDLSGFVENFRKAYDLVDIERRLVALEKAKARERARERAYGSQNGPVGSRQPPVGLTAPEIPDDPAS